MSYDEDAVVEAMARMKPELDDLKARVAALESTVTGGAVIKEVVEYTAKLDDDTVKTYKLVTE